MIAEKRNLLFFFPTNATRAASCMSALRQIYVLTAEEGVSLGEGGGGD